MEERLGERTRIAQDLHDTVLQGLLSVSLQLAVTNARLADSEPTKPHYGNILSLLRQLVEESRNAVRGLRKLTSDSNTLEQAFARIPQDLAAQTDLRLTVEGATRALRPFVQEEVYLIGREALANAFRHARASQVEAVIQYEEEGLHVAIRDNGLGIDSAILEAGRSGHFGLSGMRERAERMGAELRVSSALNSGTEIELFVPGTSAYQFPTRSRSVAWLEKIHLRRRVGVE
jgi:signal transduction histidine kinase